MTQPEFTDDKWEDFDAFAKELEEASREAGHHSFHPIHKRPPIDLSDVRPRTSTKANARKQEIITAGTMLTLVLLIVIGFVAVFVYKVTNGGCVMGGPKDLCISH